MEKTLNKKIFISEEYQVIVVGGGPAGCGAAIAAARGGAKTLIIEKTGMLGGAATAGLVNAWAPFSDGKRIIYSGIAQEIFQTMKKSMYHVPQNETRWVPIDAEILKRVYDEVMEKYGVTVLFNSDLCGVEMCDEAMIDYILVANKAGLTGYHAQVFIDGTGDGDVAHWAGATCWQGDEMGKMQAATHCFLLSNVDEFGYYKNNYYNLHPTNPESAIHKIVKDSRFNISDTHCCSDFSGPKVMGFNAGHLENVDGTNPFSVSKALVAGRKLAAEFCRALAVYEPRAFANAMLVETAPTVGIRETRRIEGDYVFTVEDYLNRASFPDEICRNNYYLDVHGTKIVGGISRYRQGESHGIPFRCLIPKGLKNLLVAGRAISSERVVNGSLRVMPVCLSTGEAAGVAAVQAITEQREIDLHHLDVLQIRKVMKANGAYLP